MMKKLLSVLVVSVLVFSVQSFATLSVSFAEPAIINNTPDVMIISRSYSTWGTMADIVAIKGDVAVSVLDGDFPPGNGATLGSFNSMPIFKAYIDGVEVATLLDGGYSLTAAPMLVASDTDTFGWESYSGSVDMNISIEILLTVSPGDTASITGDFEVTDVVPEPATMGLLALGGLLLRKRK